MKKYRCYQAWPLWLQITVALFVLCTLVVIATGEFVRHKDHRYLIANIDENKQRVVDVIGSTAIESIITEDIPVLNTIVNQLTASNSDIVALNIVNEDMVKLAGWKNNIPTEEKYLLSHSDPIIFEGETFGYIHIIWNLQRKLSDIDDHILGTYLFNSFALFLFTVISILGVNWLVTRPIQDIEARLLDHTQGKELPTETIKTSREFAKLYAAVDKIRQLTISKDELENEVYHRKIAQDELTKAHDVALRATEAKSIFLANMSHEIRTPLTAIVGFSESLLDNVQTMSERIDSIQTIIRSGKHLQSLINDILDLSKIEAGKLDIHYQTVSLFELLTDVHALAKLQADEKALTCELNYHFPLPEKVFTDQLRLKQILINLCGNAVKFTSTGGIRLDVRYLEPDKRLQVKVIDTGIGMTAEQQSDIFNAFTQGDGSITRTYGGTGLGLHLSKMLTEKMGGEITLESTVDVGSCFTLTIDTGHVGQQRMLSQEPEQSQTTQTESKVLSGHVLLAEDNQDNQRLISLMLRKTGVDVSIANNGQEVLDLVQNDNFDLILMDMQMPVMNGMDATHLLRKSDYKGNIVALTANATTEDRKTCLANGFDGFLTKPINHQEFNETLSHYLSDAGTHTDN